MCIQGKGAVKAVGCADTNVDNGKQKLPKKHLTNPPTCAIISMFLRERNQVLGHDLP